MGSIQEEWLIYFHPATTKKYSKWTKWWCRKPNFGHCGALQYIPEKKIWIKTIFSITAALALLPLAALAGHHKGGDQAVAAEQMGDDVVWASGARGIVAEVEGEVIAVDMETRGGRCSRAWR